MNDRYSQNAEQDFILQHFSRRPLGRFLDIGAYNGKTFSNTLALVEKGWGGVCVEPSPIPGAELLRLHEKNPLVEIIFAALSTSAGLLKFSDSMGDAISSSSDAHVEKWAKGYNVNFRPIWVCSITVEMLLNGFGRDYHFLNIDVESTNEQILHAFPFKEMQNLSLICIEHDGRALEMESHLQPHGFRAIHINAENLILERT